MTIKNHPDAYAKPSVGCAIKSYPNLKRAAAAPTVRFMDLKIFNHIVPTRRSLPEGAAEVWKCSRCSRPVRRDSRAVAATLYCPACEASVRAPAAEPRPAGKREWVA